MMNSGHLAQEKVEIKNILRFEFLSIDVIICFFRFGAKFTSKGAFNHDLLNVYSLFKKV